MLSIYLVQNLGLPLCFLTIALESFRRDAALKLQYLLYNV